MPGTVIGKTLNYGYPGQISRQGDEVSRTRPVKEGTNNINFGAPVVVNADGTFQVMGTGHKAENFAGVAMRRVKSALEYPNQNRVYYMPNEACDILERGSITVECVNGTPTVGGDVYVYVVAASGHKLGEFSATADAANTVKLTNARWGSDKDARNVAELTLITRQGV